MSSRHPKTSHNKNGSSSSSSPPRSLTPRSSSTHPSMSSKDPPIDPIGTRRRRGRQARPTQLSSKMRRACRKFSDAVGAPQVVEPAGFRDFRGWLTRLGSRHCRDVWDELLAVIAKEVDCDVATLHSLKNDIVREIIKCVVVARPGESAKLVSTNAGRQASRPRSGTTLMIVLDDEVARVEKRLPQLVEQMTPSSSSSDRSDVVMTSSSDGIRRQDRQRGSHTTSSRSRHHSDTPLDRDRLPSVADLLNNRSYQRLPSFRELDASLKRGSGSRR